MCFDEFEAQYKLGVSILKITLIVSKLRKKKKKKRGHQTEHADWPFRVTDGLATVTVPLEPRK